MPAHNPNPFDFVPFAKSPLLKSPGEFDALGDRLSGYLEVRLKALTPMHIAGHQTSQGSAGTSHMYRQDGAACIPAASMRGCLRAFIEALTSGWVSQANPEYPKKYGKEHPNEGRHIGFRAFEEYSPDDKQILSRTSPPAIDKEYESRLRPDSKIDVASYLFGMVLEKRKDIQSKHAGLARKSKIIIEDAFLADKSVESGSDWIPDVAGKSFMGGGKPSASTWWYMAPERVWVRNVNTEKGMKRTAEFIGNKFWGRKFYYHQEPEACLQYYKTSWKFKPERPLYPVHLECQKRGTQTEPFRIYLEGVPRPLAVLLVLALSPGRNIRHKLGYGKAYGYGSVEFCLEQAQFRPADPASRIPAPLEDYLAAREIQKWTALAWEKDELAKNGLGDAVIDSNALAHLARVLGWQDHEKLKFTYPPYDSTYFKQPVTEGQLAQVSKNLGEDESALRQIAENLLEIKKTIHFRYYQEQAEGWSIISARKP